MRIDGYDGADIAKEELVTVKEVWLSQEHAESEAARLNALNADKSIRYFVQYTRLERDS